MECKPENCPGLDPRAAREAKAKELYGRGWTEEAIAKFLRVSQSTIHRDLANLFVTNKLKRPKTSTNPQGGEEVPSENGE